MMQIHEDVFPEPQAWWVQWLLGACSLGGRGVPSRQIARDWRSLGVTLQRVRTS